jgi:hypothetical protein
MKKRAMAATGAAFLWLSGGSAIAGDVCGELWYERNQIYKDGGYCFKTSDAIRAFGNAGCSFDDVEDVPLSARQRRAVQRILAAERRNGCR